MPELVTSKNDDRKENIIMYATRNFKYKLATKLLKNTKININDKDYFGETLLFMVNHTMNHYNELMDEILKKKNLDVNIETIDGNTALTRNKFSLDYLKILIDKGADINHSNKMRPPTTVLHNYNGDFKTIKFIMEHPKFNLKQHDIDPLLFNLSNYDTTKYLFDKGAKITLGPQHARTPLFSLHFMSDKDAKDGVKIAQLVIDKAVEQGFDKKTFINERKIQDPKASIWPWEVGETALYEIVQGYPKKNNSPTLLDSKFGILRPDDKKEADLDYKEKLDYIQQLITFLLKNGADPDIEVPDANGERARRGLSSKRTAREVAEEKGIGHLFNGYPKNK